MPDFWHSTRLLLASNPSGPSSKLKEHLNLFVPLLEQKASLLGKELVLKEVDMLGHPLS